MYDMCPYLGIGYFVIFEPHSYRLGLKVLLIFDVNPPARSTPESAQSVRSEAATLMQETL